MGKNIACLKNIGFARMVQEASGLKLKKEMVKHRKVFIM